MGSVSLSPAFGQRLLPVEIDRIAREDSERVIFYTPRSNQPAKGYDVVTAGRFANAINRTCWWLESEVGAREAPKTIAYLGQNDLRYFLLIVAATKIGHKVLLLSPRNSIEGHLSLIRQSGCELWITSSGIGKLEFLQRLGLPCIQVPALDGLLEPSPVKPYHYDKRWQEGRSDVLALLHTTGSTGMPRLIPLTLGSVATGDALHLAEPIEGKMPTLVEWTGTRMLCAMPLFHVAGLSFGLCCPVFCEWKIVLPPAVPAMQHVVEETLDHIDIDSAFVSPVVLVDICKTPRILDKIARLKFVTSAGGPIPRQVGELIHSRVHVWQTMGMTEGLLVPSVITHPDEWAYFHFHPCCGFEMRPYSDTFFELVFVKKKELAATQAIFLTFPDLDTYETKDLYTRHPTIPHLYKYETRKDDLVVLSSGEKFNPLAAEMQLSGHAWVSAAYIAGRGHFQASVLVHPAEERLGEPDAAIIEAVWPAVHAVNQSLPAFAQILQGSVRVVRTPFPRTPKGTLARHEIERLFSLDISSIYEDGQAPERTQTPAAESDFLIDGTSEASVRAGVVEAIQMVSPGLDLGTVSHDDSLLENGFDSLHVIRLARLLSSAFTPSPVPVESSTIYAHPSICQLSQVLWEQLQTGRPARDGRPCAGVAQENEVAQVLSRHLPSFRLSRAEPREHVVLTGSTGAIGSYVLDALCRSDRIAKVWCINRSRAADAACRQAALAQSRGLSSDWKGKVRFVQADFAAKALGLSPADQKEIRDRATVIFHNAWEVNFNLPLASFETQFAGLQSLVQIGTESRAKIRFFFVSSVSGTMRWPCHVLGPVPEAKISNLDAPVNGYGASKLAAEHLLSTAAQSGAIRLSVLRVGQVAGPTVTRGRESMWTRRDWVPAVIDASAYLRKLPADLGSATAVDWIPVDMLATIMVQLVLSHARPKEWDRQEGETFYNLVNPQTTSWSVLLPAIKARLETFLAPEKMQVVSFSEWLDDLQNAEAAVVQNTTGEEGVGRAHTMAERTRTGLKLLPFFRELAHSPASVEGGFSGDDISSSSRWTTDNAFAGSTIFAGLPPVSAAWFETWLDQWGY